MFLPKILSGKSRATAGRFAAFYEMRLSPWDYAAGSLIVTEAGGRVSALDGSPLRFYDRCSVAAGNRTNHAELIALSQNIGKEPDMKGRIL